VLRLYRFELSTNVERVALALAHKALEVESVWVDPDDRSPVRDVSGQELVPVLVDGESVVADSTRILEHLEKRFPAPPLYPLDPAKRAEARLFVDWFNRVWKRPPNEIDAELDAAEPDRERIEALGAELAASLDLFDALLTGREYLLGEFSVADCAVFPFLRFALFHEEDDPWRFHHILVEHLRLDERHGNLRAWLERMDERPRA
jgi:glutathione S-transferase